MTTGYFAAMDHQLKLIRRAVLLVSVTLMIYQVYLSLAEYQKREYVQVPEDSTLSKVTLPRIVVCNEQGFKEKVNMSLFTGMHPIYAKQKPNFFGWSKKDMTTKHHLESLVTLHTKSQLFFKALLAKSMMSFGNQKDLTLSRTSSWAILFLKTDV